MFKKILKILKKILKIEELYPIAYLVIENIKTSSNEKEKMQELKIKEQEKLELLNKICDELTLELTGQITKGLLKMKEYIHIHPFCEDASFQINGGDEKFEKVGISATRGVFLNLKIKEEVIKKVKNELEKYGFKIKKIKIFEKNEDK